MRRRSLRFWGLAVGVAAAVAVAAALLLPYEAIGLRTGEERERAWLVTVWTAGMFAILFGLTARLGGGPGLSVRDVEEAGSVAAAVEARRRARKVEEGFRVDVWLVATGGILVGIYFAGWLLLR